MFLVGRSFVILVLGAIFLFSSVDLAMAAPSKGGRKSRKSRKGQAPKAPGEKKKSPGEEAVTSPKLSVDKLLEEAIMRRGLADFEGSQGRLEQALKLSKVPAELAKIHLLMGANYLDMDKEDKAQAAMLAALGRDPSVQAAAEMKTAVRNLLARFRKAASGTLMVQANLPARVGIDGKDAGNTPYTAKLPIGSHQVTLRGPGGVKQEHEIVVYPDRTAKLKVRLKAPVAKKRASEKKGGRLFTWIVGATAVAAAGAGLGVWLWADADFGEWEDLQTGPNLDAARLTELEDGIRTKEIASYALWGTAGALAVTSVVLFMLEPGFGAEKQQAATASVWDRMTLTPVAGQAPGLMLQGTY